MATLSKWLPIGADNNQIFYGRPNKPTTIDIVGGIFCHICHLTFVNKKEFDSHYTNHGLGTTDILYTCVVCHKEIVGYPSFRGHCYLAHVTKDKFKCEHCNKIFSKLCVLRTHVKKTHEKKCLTCQAEFKSKKELILHNVIHKNTEISPPYKCQTCGEQMETCNDCEDHMEEHCSMLYNCPICNKEIADIQYAASHLTMHFGEVLKSKSSDDTLETIEISNDCAIDLSGGIVCCYCRDTYKARQDFDNHFAEEHPDKELVYSCNICGKGFEQHLTLARHCYDHSTKDRFECEECFKTFPRLSLLVIHVESHHESAKAPGPLPFNCLQCNQGFHTDRRLKEHYKTVHKICYNQCPQHGCDKTSDTEYKRPKETKNKKQFANHFLSDNDEGSTTSSKNIKKKDTKLPVKRKLPKKISSSTKKSTGWQLDSDSEDETAAQHAAKQGTLTSSLSRRVADGVLRRTADLDGDVFIDLKVYNVRDILPVEPKDRWEHAVVSLKFQCDSECSQMVQLTEVIKDCKRQFTSEGKFFKTT